MICKVALMVPEAEDPKALRERGQRMWRGRSLRLSEVFAQVGDIARDIEIEVEAVEDRPQLERTTTPAPR
jgi:hypothetical protein